MGGFLLPTVATGGCAGIGSVQRQSCEKHTDRPRHPPNRAVSLLAKQWSNDCAAFVGARIVLGNNAAIAGAALGLLRRIGAKGFDLDVRNWRSGLRCRGSAGPLGCSVIGLDPRSDQPTPPPSLTQSGRH